MDSPKDLEGLLKTISHLLPPGNRTRRKIDSVESVARQLIVSGYIASQKGMDLPGVFASFERGDERALIYEQEGETILAKWSATPADAMNRAIRIFANAEESRQAAIRRKKNKPK